MLMRPFDWLMLLFCLVVGLRFIATDQQRGAFDFAIASTVVLMTLAAIASVVLR